MEENRNSCPMDLCEKIYKAICCITHRPQDPIPANPAPNPSLPASNHAVKTHDVRIIPITAQHPKPSEGAQRLETPKNREAANLIPINFDYSSLPAPPNGNGNIQKNGQVPKVAPKMEPGKEVVPGQGQVAEIGPQPPRDKAPPTQPIEEDGQKTGTHDDRFTEFINRAKIKIRSMSIGDKKSASGEDKGKDHFSDYIERAKIRMRTTSSVGGGRSQSFK